MNMSSSEDNIEIVDNNEEFDDYMDPVQLKFFREKLEDWLKELEKEHKEIGISNGNAEESNVLGKQFTDDIEFTTNDRYLQLKKDIQSSLRRIKDGTYGYCEATGEKIGIERLKANPITLYCIEEQERRDRQ